jgi:hypothetical protein
LWRQRYKIAPAIDLLPKEPDDQQKNYGADDSVYDGRKNAANENEPDQRKQPTCNHRAPTMPTTMLPINPKPSR